MDYAGRNVWSHFNVYFWVVFSSFKTSPHLSKSPFKRWIAVTLQKMFRGLRNFTWLSISVRLRGWWVNFNHWVNSSFKCLYHQLCKGVKLQVDLSKIKKMKQLNPRLSARCLLLIPVRSRVGFTSLGCNLFMTSDQLFWSPSAQSESSGLILPEPKWVYPCSRSVLP